MMQGFESNCGRVKKKEKKMKKLDSGTAEVGCLSGCPDVTDGVEYQKVHKRKSGVSKAFAKHAASEVENGINSSSEAEHAASKKKKSMATCAVNGHKIKRSKSSEVFSATEQKADEVDIVSASGGLAESSSFQQSDAHLKSSSVDKKRKRKNKEEKKVGLNSQDSIQCVEEHYSKKLKTRKESQLDKTVVSTGTVHPGAFENYRISQSLIEKLRCM